MTDSDDWKRYFLASGVPLEYEVARNLAQAGFAVDSDYEYLRKDAGNDKQFSIDVDATWILNPVQKFSSL